MAELLAIDWGLSSFRMYLMDGNGEVQQRFSSESGVLTLQGGDFEQCLGDHLREFGAIPAETPKIASGMITSNRGWCETPYVTCPATTEALAAGLVHHEMRALGSIWFVPGVDQVTPEPDIMRGEETQLAGLAVQDTVTAILPGTHSKWASLSANEISRFKTFMTGELYAILMEHSILGHTSESIWSDIVFKEGVQTGYSFRNRHKGLLSELFQVRVKTIKGGIGDGFVASYVSGLLLGCEIADAIGSGFEPGTTKQIIGEKRLARLYQIALAECSMTAEIVEDDITAAGLYRIAQNAGLV
jgi:2-dehydro-3-deoxygalactonokinase